MCLVWRVVKAKPYAVEPTVRPLTAGQTAEDAAGRLFSLYAMPRFSNTGDPLLMSGRVTGGLSHHAVTPKAPFTRPIGKPDNCADEERGRRAPAGGIHSRGDSLIWTCL